MSKTKSSVLNSSCLTLFMFWALLVAPGLTHAAGKVLGPCANIEKACTDFSPGKSKKNSELWKECIRSVMSSGEGTPVTTTEKFPQVPPAQVVECRQFKPNFGKVEKSVLEGGGKHE